MIRARVVQFFCIAVVLAMPATALSQVRDGAAAAAPVAPAPTGTGAISGVVMSGDSASRPLRMANVVLIGTLTGVLKVTSTDRDGKFSFTSLPVDRYTVGASKAPYLGAVAGARRPARPGTGLVLAAGQKVSDVVIRLPLAAAISGVITDELGRPAQALIAVQQRKLQNGERTLVNAGNIVQSDDRGRYRIYGLVPGEYVVSAYRTIFAGGTPRQLTDREFDDAMRGIVPPLGPAPVPMRYVPIYYPGTPKAAEAGGILLATGEERTGVDMRLEFGSLSKVEGTLMTSEGAVPENASVVLVTVTGSSTLTMSMSARVGPDGRFTLMNVAPGSYLANGVASGAQSTQFAITPVEVNGADVTGVQLVLRPPMTMTGRVVFDGASQPPPAGGITVPFKPMLGAQSGGSTQATVTPTTADGLFRIQRVSPGRYVVGGPLSFGASANSMMWSLQSVTADGKDITDRPIDVMPETLPKEVVVTISDKWQNVSGKLMQASGAPATDYTVVVFPSDKNYWFTGSRRILIAKPDSTGQFTLGGAGMISLPAGEYMLAAVTELDRDEQFDPALLASLLTAAVPLSIQPGERKVQDLVIR